MTTEERKILDYLMKVDITIEHGISYIQLIEYLKFMKFSYKQMLESNQYLKNVITSIENKSKKIEDDKKQIEDKLCLLEQRYNNIMNKIVKNDLTIKERLSGKINIEKRNNKYE